MTASAAPQSLPEFSAAQKTQPNAFYLLNFWAPWAAPCAQTNEIFSDLSKKYGNQMIFWSVCVDVGWGEEMIDRMMIAGGRTSAGYSRGIPDRSGPVVPGRSGTLATSIYSHLTLTWCREAVRWITWMVPIFLISSRWWKSMQSKLPFRESTCRQGTSPPPRLPIQLLPKKTWTLVCVNSPRWRK